MNPPRLVLEFAPRAPRISGAAAIALATAALVLIATALYLGYLVLSQDQSRRALALAVDVSSKPAFAEPRPTKTNPMELAQIKAARQTSLSLITPWPDLLTALETTPPNVALLSVEPAAATRSVSLSAEAAGPVQMLQYLRTLQKNPHLRDVTLVSHQLQEQAPGTPLRFQLRAIWGDAP
jgi:Tfp pilus assembly protein PilN